MRFIREADVQRAGINFGIDGNRGNMQIAAGANNPHGNLATICN
jgi:hypothetical protein